METIQNKQQYDDFSKEDLIKQLEMVEAAHRAQIQRYAYEQGKLLKIIKEYAKDVGNYNKRCMYGGYKPD